LVSDWSSDVCSSDLARALLARLAAARLHAPRLELAAIRATRDLAIGVLPRQPDLDVEGLLRREAHIASAQGDDAVRQAEALQHLDRKSGVEGKQEDA